MLKAFIHPFFEALFIHSFIAWEGLLEGVLEVLLEGNLEGLCERLLEGLLEGLLGQRSCRPYSTATRVSRDLTDRAALQAWSIDSE